jgi:putative FmdB family regulatory protein
MPIYEFACGKCKHTFEVLCRMSDTATPACPQCTSKKTRKLMSVFGGKVGNTSAGGGCGTCSATSCGPS